METKYAKLIDQLERVTGAYSLALRAVKDLESEIGNQPDILSMSGGVTWYGDKFESGRAIQLSADTFTPLAIDCGSDFSLEHLEKYTRFCCTVFGYRVFTLVYKGSAEEAYLLDLVAADAKSQGE